MPSIVVGVEHPSATGMLLTLAAIAIKDSGISQTPSLENNTIRIRFSTETQASLSLRRTRDIIEGLRDVLQDRDEEFTYRLFLASSDISGE